MISTKRPSVPLKGARSSLQKEPTPSKRIPLSTERIVAAAIALMDREGMAGLTMRKLGADLNVEAMSLYRHFPNKNALLAATRVALFGKLQHVGADQSDGFERLRAVMRATYRLVEENPCFVDLLFSGQSEHAPEQQRDADLAALRSAGLTHEGAEYALMILISFVVGFLYHGGPATPERRKEGFEIGLNLILDGLRRSAAPHGI